MRRQAGESAVLWAIFVDVSIFYLESFSRGTRLGFGMDHRVSGGLSGHCCRPHVCAGPLPHVSWLCCHSVIQPGVFLICTQALLDI